MTTLFGRRIVLRPLAARDFAAWREVRRFNDGWLTKWEPRRDPSHPDVVESRDAFAVRCSARQRERQLGTGAGFGIFVDGRFRGEVNLNAIHRGALQSADVGYWIDERSAGQGYVPESVVIVFRHAFEDLGLHRVQIAIIPRNHASIRVAEKLGLRCEGLAERLLEIDGIWEDHYRYAITAEEWDARRADLWAEWIADPTAAPSPTH